MENLLTPKNILKSIAGLIVFIILLVNLLAHLVLLLVDLVDVNNYEFL